MSTLLPMELWSATYLTKNWTSYANDCTAIKLNGDDLKALKI
jgi:hypothetical protein